MIKFKNISYSYGPNSVFRDFSLNLNGHHNIISILGHNGAGKTTLLKIIEGSLKPQRGEVENPYSNKDVFMLADKGNMYNDMTVANNLTFLQLLKQDQLKSLVVKEREKKLITQLFLEKHLNKKFFELSSGLKTRANLLAGLIYDPELILLDEPTNTIDPMSRKILIDIISELSHKGKQVVIVTHDLDFCYEISDVNLILNEGTIISEESVDRTKISLENFKTQYLKYTEEAFCFEGDLV